MFMRAALVLIATWLLAAADARASAQAAYGATVVRPARNAMVDEIRGLAVAFWSDRDVDVPPGESYLIDRCDGCHAYEVGPDIYVIASMVADVQAHRMWEVAAGTLCATVVHEVGHAGGLGHTATGVMSADVEIPWPCRRWARDRRAEALSIRRARDHVPHGTRADGAS